MKNKEKKNVIEIQEDVRVPGTDILLEKGDRIEVLNEGYAHSKFRIPFLTWLESGDFNNHIEFLVEKDGYTEIEAISAALSTLEATLEMFIGRQVTIEWEDR